MTDSTQKPRIWVDFQNSDTYGRVRLSSVGTVDEVNRLGIVLSEGLDVVLYCLELEADGVVLYSAEEKRWVAKVDWDKVRDRRVEHP
jgi:hypothetical protein